MIGIIEDLGGDWRRLDERIERVTEEIEQLAHGSESCRQLMTVPGIGPLIASAMVAAIANGAAFAKGRDFAAWLGLVPKQRSTGDRTILGHISKRGNRYLRTLFMQGARVILLRPANWARHSFGPWLAAAAKFDLLDQELPKSGDHNGRHQRDHASALTGLKVSVAILRDSGINAIINGPNSPQ